MNPRILRGWLPLSAGLLFSVALQIQAATVYVGWDSDSGFSPASVRVNPGDTVVWVNNDPIFPAIVSGDDFSFYLVNEGDEYAVEFNTLGTYGYSDSPWSNTGTVSVVLPGIELTTPVIVGDQFLFDVIRLTPGKTNVLEVSTNLTSWTAVTTNVAASSSASFSRPVVSGSEFYRLIELP
jgi:plastocyanin